MDETFLPDYGLTLSEHGRDSLHGTLSEVIAGEMELDYRPKIVVPVLVWFTALGALRGRKADAQIEKLSEKAHILSHFDMEDFRSYAVDVSYSDVEDPLTRRDDLWYIVQPSKSSEAIAKSFAQRDGQSFFATTGVTWGYAVFRFWNSDRAALQVFLKAEK